MFYAIWPTFEKCWNLTPTHRYESIHTPHGGVTSQTRIYNIWPTFEKMLKFHFLKKNKHLMSTLWKVTKILLQNQHLMSTSWKVTKTWKTPKTYFTQLPEHTRSITSIQEHLTPFTSGSHCYAPQGTSHPSTLTAASHCLTTGPGRSSPLHLAPTRPSPALAHGPCPGPGPCPVLTLDNRGTYGLGTMCRCQILTFLKK